MRACPVERGKIEIRNRLVARAVLGAVDVIVSEAPIRRIDVQTVAVRDLARKGPIGSEPELSYRAAPEIELVLSVSKPLPLPLAQGGLRRIECAEPHPVRVPHAGEKTEINDVRGREVRLYVQKV